MAPRLKQQKCSPQASLQSSYHNPTHKTVPRQEISGIHRPVANISTLQQQTASTSELYSIQDIPRSQINPYISAPYGNSRIVTPYLKEGKHGSSGEFKGDPDCATGKGHNYDINDSKLYQEYLEHRAAFYRRYPIYPRLEGGVQVAPMIKAEWNKQEKWYRTFRDKYPGSRTNQWVCGCERVVAENDGESESEAE